MISKRIQSVELVQRVGGHGTDRGIRRDLKKFTNPEL